MQGRAQLTLEDCYQYAHDNYPAIRQYGLVEQTKEFNLSNAAKGYLPQVSLSAGAYAFTDVVDMPGHVSQTSGNMKNHLLNAGVQFSQLIYDGGAIGAAKGIVRAQSEVEKEQLNVTMYDVRSRVLQLYFGILMIDEQLAQSDLLQQDLQLSLNTVQSMQNAGLANQTDVDAVKVEQVKVKQGVQSLRSLRRSYLQMLGIFIGKQLADDTTLPPPLAFSLASQENLRPELALFESQGRLLDAQKRKLDAQLRPKLSAFALGMYHNKVMGLMRDNMLAAGLSFSWNISSLYTRKNDLRKLEVQRKQIDSSREIFLFNTNLQSEQTNGVISDLKEKIALDDELIALRKGIRDKAQKRVENGIETVNEMLREINAVSEARQAKALHEIQLLQEIYRMKHLYNY